MSSIKESLSKLSSPKKSFGWPFWVFVAGCLFSLLILVRYSGLFAGSLDINQLSLQQVQTRTIHPQYSSTGVVTLSTQRVLTARKSGTVESIHVNSGTTVSAGDLLIQLDNPDAVEALEQMRADYGAARNENLLTEKQLELELNSQTSAIQLAEAELELAEAQHHAQQQLRERNIVSEIDFTVSQLSLHQARIQLEQERQNLILAEQGLAMHRSTATQQLERLRRQLEIEERRVEHLTVTAPSDLTILSLDDSLSLGATAETGMPLIRFYQSGDLAIRMRMPPRFLQNVSSGNVAYIRLANETLDAEVSHVESQVEGGSLPLWINASQPLENYFTEGQDSRVRITFNAIENARVIEEPEWYQGPGEYSLYCLQGMTLTPCDIELGLSDGRYVIVESSLTPDIRIETSRPNHWLGSIPREVTP